MKSVLVEIAAVLRQFAIPKKEYVTAECVLNVSQ